MLPWNSRVDIDGDCVRARVWNLSADRSSPFELDRVWSLSRVIQEMSEDGGCIALAVPRLTRDAIIWQETTRFSYAERVSRGRTHSTALLTGLSTNTDGSGPGAHNPASPAKVLTDLGPYVPILYALTPAKNCASSEISIMFHVAVPDATVPESHFSENSVFVNGEDARDVDTIVSLKQFLIETHAPVEILGPESVCADGRADFQIRCPKGANVFLSTNAGVLNKHEVEDGESFSLYALGLSAGQRIRIKAGYEFFSGKARKDAIVV